MWLVVQEEPDMPIVKHQWLYEDKFYADRKAKSLMAEGEEARVIELPIEDQFFCKPSTDESKRLVWGEQYV